jgi:serine protease Do
MNLRSMLMAATLWSAVAIPCLAAAPSQAQEAQPMPSLAPMVKRVSPSVVSIAVRGTIKEQAQRNPLFDDPFFRRFFDVPQDSRPRERQFRSAGSGVVVDAKNGYIITNHHVVAKVDHIKVRLHDSDGAEYRARVVGIDPETDVAVLKIDPRGPLTPVNIGNSDAVQVGDWAVAIGSPFGLEASVTAGIVSALGRNIDGPLQLQRFIQTDAAINPGNSGGPLLNIRGEVIGINTMIATQSGGYQGIGFALPINMVVHVYNDIIKTGRVARGSIGVQWSKADKPELFKALGTNQGVLVSKVQEGGPAEKAGMKADDIIIAMNSKPVKDGEELVSRVSEMSIGTPITLTVDRDGKHMDFKLSIMDRAEVFKDRPEFAEFQQHGDSPAKPEEAQYKFGIKLHSLTDAERSTMGIEGKGGLVVRSIDEGSFAEDIGLFEKDVILSINRQPVTSVEDVIKIQSTLKPGDPVAFRVMRPGPGGRGHAPQWTTFFVSGSLPMQ